MKKSSVKVFEPCPGFVIEPCVWLKGWYQLKNPAGGIVGKFKTQREARRAIPMRQVK